MALAPLSQTLVLTADASTVPLAELVEIPSGIVIAPVTISGTPGAATVGTAYTFTPAASGGLGTKTFALTGTLPAGLTFSTSTGAISGTPTTAGTASGLKITVSDPTGANAALGAFAIVVGANVAIIAPARFAAYSDDFETSGDLTNRPNWSDLGSGQISRWSTGNGFLYNNNLYNSYNVVVFGAQVSDFIVTLGYDSTGTYFAEIADNDGWDKFRQSNKIWYRDDDNNLDASYDPDAERLSIGGVIGGTSIESARFDNVQYLPKGDIVFVMQAGKLRIRLDGKWLQNGPNLDYPFDQIDLSSAIGASDRIGYFGIGAGTWRYAQAQYLSVTPLDITVDFVNDAVGRDVVGGATGTADIRGSFVGTPSRWIYRLLSYGTTTVVQDWREMGAVSAADGTWSGTVSLPLGGPYAVEAGYLAADGSLRSATSNATMCAIRGTYYGQSNSTGRGGNSYSPATTSGPVAARTDTVRGIPNGTFANGNRAYSFPSAYEAPRVANTASGTPFFMDIRGVAGVGINALVPGGGAWQTFLDGVACTRGVIEFVIWDQGEGDADGAGTLSGYADTYRNELLPAMRTATGNPGLKVFINPVGRYASTTQPAASFNTEAGNDANREILRQAYLTIIANEPNVSFAASKLGCVHTDSYHYGAPGYVEMGRREGWTIAKAFGAAAHDGIGPKVASATRAGAVITLAINLNGANGLTGPIYIETGEVPNPVLGNALNGFQVSKDGFATTLPISTMAISGNTLVITLASDPGAAVSIRSHYGWSYDDTNTFYGAYSDTTPIPVFPIMTPVVAA